MYKHSTIWIKATGQIGKNHTTIINFTQISSLLVTRRTRELKVSFKHYHKPTAMLKLYCNMSS